MSNHTLEHVRQQLQQPDRKGCQLEAISIRPEGKNINVLLLQFTGNKFASISFQKNESIVLVAGKISRLLHTITDLA